MKFNKIAKALHISAIAASTIAAASALTACGIFDESDCVSSYNQVRFVFDHNMKFADAFDNEVDHVTLLVFNKSDGTLVRRIDAPHIDLNENNELTLDIEPGNYDLLTWAGNHSGSFDIAEGNTGLSNIVDFHCRMRRLQEDDGAHIRGDIAHLWHSEMSVELPFASPSNPNMITIGLKKNTNVFRIVLQHISGETIDGNDFDITITDSNGWLNHDNSLREDETLTYHPWYEYSGSVDINTNPKDPGQGSAGSVHPESRASLGAMLAEITTGRLLETSRPILTVRSKKDKRIILQIPVIDYALMVKGFYNRELSDQEYLDRQDEYNMTFFLDEGNRWLNTVIIINDWRIIRSEGPVA